jgi:hypothetical protein
MMSAYNHLPDENLLLLADGELTARRATEANAHLSSCWECRARLRQLEETIADFVEVHHRVLDPQLPLSSGPRALLKARLALAEEGARRTSWLHGFQRNFGAARLAAVGALAVLVVCGTVMAREFLVPSGKSGLPSLSGLARREPDRRLTPGAARAVSTSEVCRAHYSDDTHMLPAAIRERVFQEYGVKGQQSKYEVDYLISPQLGGTDDIRNLWPEPEAVPDWNVRAKDELEDRLRQMVCDGTIELSTAQRDLSTDWIAAYKRYFRTDKPGVPL